MHKEPLGERNVARVVKGAKCRVYCAKGMGTRGAEKAYRGDKYELAGNKNCIFLEGKIEERRGKKMLWSGNRKVTPKRGQHHGRQRKGARARSGYTSQ